MWEYTRNYTIYIFGIGQSAIDFSTPVLQFFILVCILVKLVLDIRKHIKKD